MSEVIADILNQIESIGRYLNFVSFPGECMQAYEVLKNLSQVINAEKTKLSQFDPQLITSLNDSIKKVAALSNELQSPNWCESNFDYPIQKPMNELNEFMKTICQICKELQLNLTESYDPSLELIISDYQNLIGIYEHPMLSKDVRQPQKLSEIHKYITELISQTPQPTKLNSISSHKSLLEFNLESKSDAESDGNDLTNIQKYKKSKLEYIKAANPYADINNEIKFYRGTFLSNRKPITIISMGAEHKDLFKRMTGILTVMKYPGLETFIGASSTLPYEIITDRTGEELSKIIRKPNEDEESEDMITLVPGDRTKFAFKIAQAAAFLHSHNIIHRDLSTSNILIEKNKNPKIINFANSRVMPEDKRNLTRNLPSFSPFRAPELHIGSDKYDESVDVFAYAGILYELLNGCPPFSKESSQFSESKIIDGQRPAIKKCSPALKELIQSCWGQDPAKRPSFADIVDRMLSNRICFPVDENSESLKKFYDSNSVKNTDINMCLELFKQVSESISNATVYHHELIRVCSILHSYQFILQNNNLAKQDKDFNYLIEGHLSNIKDALEELVSIIQNTAKDRWGSIALMSPAPQVSISIHDKMDEIYVAMTELRFTDIPKYVFVDCDLLPDFRYIYSIFNKYRNRFVEPAIRMQEIVDFLKQYDLTVEVTPIEINETIQKNLNQFKNYEKARASYKIVKTVTSGLTSTIFLAKDLSRNKELVAIKEFNDEYLVDESAFLRLKREITFLVTLNFPYLVTFIGFNSDPGLPFWVISEYASNGDLFKAIYHKKLNGFQKTKIMFEIAEGMEYLHERHVLHRDLKTANVLLQGDTPKITDFGYAKTNLNLRNTEKIGTINYMAPEVFKTNNYTYAADVCSYSRMLWEVYDGRCPWSWVRDPNEVRLIIETNSQALPFLKPLSNELKLLIESGYQVKASKRPTFTEILNTMISQKISFPDSDPILIEQFYQEKAQARNATSK